MAGENEAGQSAYDSLSEIAPPRTDVAINPELEDDLAGSLSQRMKVSPKMSDTQIVDKRLFPILRETVEWLNHLMVARIMPETYMPLRTLIVKHLLKTYKGYELSMTEATVLAETALSIGIDGEGRLDIVHLFSKLTEVNQEDKSKLA